MPQPIKLSVDDELTFANLTASATIYVYNTNGELVKTLVDSDGDGGKPWNMVDDSGSKLEPGIYYYKVEGNSSSVLESEINNIESELYKFMIIH
jgi:flagellar hook assembly protein FlgD